MTRDDVECNLRYAQLFIKQNQNDLSDVVMYLNYCYNARAFFPTGEFYSHSFDKFIKLGPPDANNFTPIESLSLEQVDGWIKALVGEEQYQEDIDNLKDVLIAIVHDKDTKVHYLVNDDLVTRIGDDGTKIQL